MSFCVFPSFLLGQLYSKACSPPWLFDAKFRVSHPWHEYHLGCIILSLWGISLEHCRMLRSIPGLCPLDINVTPPHRELWQPKVSPDVDKCLLGVGGWNLPWLRGVRWAYITCVVQKQWKPARGWKVVMDLSQSGLISRAGSTFGLCLQRVETKKET